MKEEIITLISSLGADGINAFYAYMIVDTLQMIICLSLVVWGVRSAWPVFKKDL